MSEWCRKYTSTATTSVDFHGLPVAPFVDLSCSCLDALYTLRNINFGRLLLSPNVYNPSKFTPQPPSSAAETRTPTRSTSGAPTISTKRCGMLDSSRHQPPPATTSVVTSRHSSQRPRHPNSPPPRHPNSPPPRHPAAPPARYALKFLRLAEKNHGSNSDICCTAHEGIAGILWTARLREKTVYHMGVALKIAEKAYRMQTDGSSEKIDELRRQYEMYRSSTPTAVCLELEDDVRAGLSRSSATRKCDAHGCKRFEGDGCTLMKCSKCQLQRYCSSECQRAEWPTHKIHCKRIAKIQVGERAST